MIHISDVLVLRLLFSDAGQDDADNVGTNTIELLDHRVRSFRVRASWLHNKHHPIDFLCQNGGIGYYQRRTIYQHKIGAFSYHIE